jgi:hypothetical protein
MSSDSLRFLNLVFDSFKMTAIPIFTPYGHLIPEIIRHENDHSNWPSHSFEKASDKAEKVTMQYHADYLHYNFIFGTAEEQDRQHIYQMYFVQLTLTLKTKRLGPCADRTTASN